MKSYDKAYFDRWYRQGKTRVTDEKQLTRKIHMVLGIAEWFLERRVKTVLDVGCGEGSWQPILKTIRPGLKYTGMDNSPYAVGRFGKSRNIVKGTFGEVARVIPEKKYDLVVCCDVLQYIEEKELIRGLRALEPRLGGLAFLEAYTRDDATEGDQSDWHFRNAAFYRRLFAKHKFTAVGMNSYVGKILKPLVLDMERS
jgi:SAM-dependent methyltransferase